MLLTLLTVATAQAAATIDYRYGRIIDNSKDLRAAGLISRSHAVSMLSGPVSLENGLEKIRSLLGIPALDPVVDLRRIIAMNPLVVENGILRDDFKSLIENYVSRYVNHKVDITLHVIGGDNFKIEDLRKTTGDHDVVIAQLWWWSNLAFTSKDPWSAPAEGGQWVVVSGFDPQNSVRFYFQDPSMQGTSTVRIEPQFQAKRKDGRTYINYQIKYETDAPYDADRTALLGNYIVLHF